MIMHTYSRGPRLPRIGPRGYRNDALFFLLVRPECYLLQMNQTQDSIRLVQVVDHACHSRCFQVLMLFVVVPALAVI